MTRELEIEILIDNLINKIKKECESIGNCYPIEINTAKITALENITLKANDIDKLLSEYNKLKENGR
jgi:hypothetical protein